MPLNLSLSVTSILEQNIEILLLVRDCEILKKSAARLFCFTEQRQRQETCVVAVALLVIGIYATKKETITGNNQKWEISKMRIRIIDYNIYLLVLPLSLLDYEYFPRLNFRALCLSCLLSDEKIK